MNETAKQQLRKEYELVLLGLSEDCESSELFDWMIEKIDQSLLSDRARLVEKIEKLKKYEGGLFIVPEVMDPLKEDAVHFNSALGKAISIIQRSQDRKVKE